MTNEETDGAPGWTFLSNHTHVLVCIATQPDIRMTDVAELVGIRERAVHRIVHDLADAGYVTVRKQGRRNVYSVNLEMPLRHPLEARHHIRAIIDPLLARPTRSASGAH
ncbi:MAG: helix-turn-helix transcriptional regulator [Ilumatobacteraceae bacterium]|jgi:DNA-binding IclR family transcriptional regulator